ncbi:substrate-binding domain-containing protein [Virgibacillus sp. 179-BFC.A HS]|uniref:Substrate-binding domain-containing protein n=1 Tax=Tigheibacillus jepli TaxID=3035914 RepID=A0ABU5CE82_9BACI|nr:substrate-binding domain-containing protein [Virgibacillus sp. 179-BFC.A HS]MDY0404647.1 substrate-binding domain-containing protein [Virgibacillus sp. 179-BFC.A HS]
MQYAKRMMDELQGAKETIQSMDNEVKGTLKLGVSTTIGRYILPKMLRDFLNRYPDVDINVITGFSSEIEPALASSDVHIAIIRGKHHWMERKMLLKTEPLLIASDYKINIDELPRLNRIYYKTDSSLKDLINDWWVETFDTKSNITMAVDNLETCKEMVKMGLGYAILPGICLQNEKHLFVEPLLHTNGKQVERKTWVYSRNSSMQFAPVKAFFDFFQEYHINEGN